MKQYTIGDLERITGIKAHTIRVWENRYGLLSPVRSDGNTRYYSESDMRRLMMVSMLNKNGMRISKIVALGDDGIELATQEIAGTNSNFDQIINAFLLYSVNFSQADLSKLLSDTIEQYGVEVAFRQIVFPFLRKVGMLWLTGKITPGHEHFFSNMCKQKLFAEIDKLPPNVSPHPHVVLFQPEWDFHELGILFYSLLLRREGISYTYLGQAVPAADAVDAITKMKAEYAIASFIAPATPEVVQNYIVPIIDQSANTHFFLTGPQLHFENGALGERVTVFRSIDDFKKLLKLT